MAVSGAALLGEERPSLAQEPGWQLLGQELPIAVGARDETAPAIAYNSRDDEYLVVWQAGQAGVADEPDIYGRRLSGLGLPLGDPIPISTAPGPQVAPAVAYNLNANEYLVVWSDLRYDHSTRLDVYGRRVAADGTLLAPELRITNRVGQEEVPRVAYNPLEDLFVVVWEEDGGGTKDTGVVAQRVRGDGRLQGQPYVVADERWKDQVPDIAYAPATNRFLVAWQYWRREIPTDYAIYACVLTGSGAVDATSPIITVAFYEDSEQKSPTVAASTIRDEQLILWQDSRESARSQRIYGGHLSGGQFQGEFRVASEVDSQAPALAYSSEADVYLAAWQARLGDGHHVLACAVDGASGAQEGIIQVTGAPGAQERPAIAYGQRAGAFLVVWQGKRDVATGLDIYGRLVGKVMPSPTTTPTETTTPTITATDTPTPSATPMPTMTETSSPIATETPTDTATPTPIASATWTPTLEPAVTISGRVRDCQGNPAAGAQVTLEGAGWQATSDEEGQYTLGPITGLGTGPHTLTATAPGLVSRSVTVELPASGVFPFDFDGDLCLAEPTATPTFTLTPTGTPSPTATPTQRPYRSYLPVLIRQSGIGTQGIRLLAEGAASSTT